MKSKELKKEAPVMELDEKELEKVLGGTAEVIKVPQEDLCKDLQEIVEGEDAVSAIEVY